MRLLADPTGLSASIDCVHSFIRLFFHLFNQRGASGTPADVPGAVSHWSDGDDCQHLPSPVFKSHTIHDCGFLPWQVIEFGRAY